MTLDAGGTSFRFSAIRNRLPATETITLPSRGDNLEQCLANLLDGFTRVKAQCPIPPVGHQFRLSRPGGLSQRHHRRPGEFAVLSRRHRVGADA